MFTPAFYVSLDRGAHLEMPSPSRCMDFMISPHGPAAGTTQGNHSLGFVDQCGYSVKV